MINKSVTLYKEDFMDNIWKELCIELGLDREYECLYLIEGDDYTHEIELYKEDFTELSWGEICKELDVENNIENITVYVSEVRIIS